jgi:hypothetical protein
LVCVSANDAKREAFRQEALKAWKAFQPSGIRKAPEMF